jgi:cell division protease FtsH
VIPPETDVTSRLEGTDVTIAAEPWEGGVLLSVLIAWFPALLLVVLLIYFFRTQAGSGRGGLMGFGKSRARTLT